MVCITISGGQYSQKQKGCSNSNSSLVFTVISLWCVSLYMVVNILRSRKDAVIVQTSFWLPIVIVVIHTMVSENIDQHQRRCN